MILGAEVAMAEMAMCAVSSAMSLRKQIKPTPLGRCREGVSVFALLR
jgi:hypothetical protein